MERATKLCPLCGRTLFWDHGLNTYNFDAHLEACPRQTRRAEAAAKRTARSIDRKRGRAFARARATGVGSAVPPTAGQLGLPFAGVPAEVNGDDDDDDDE